MIQAIDSNKHIKTSHGFSWGLERRLQFIEFRLRWEGRINRTDLTEHFGLSVPQASLDISKYLNLAPDNLHYDKSSKTYLATDRFKPVFESSSAEHYLSELLALKSRVLDSSSSFIGNGIEMDWALPPWRSIDEETVEIVVKSIREKLTIKVSYQSLSSESESVRLISPHALGHDGFRWHVRAYCHKRGRFSDFVLGRILKIHGFEPGPFDITIDSAWKTIVTLVLAPNPNLSLSQKRIIQLDYGMEDGELELNCRQALLYYTLRRLGLHDNKSSISVSQHIILKNRDHIKQYLDSST